MKPRMPETILVPTAGGRQERYKLVVWLVQSKAKGVPKICSLIPLDATVSFADGDEFYAGYVPEAMVETKK